MIKHVFSIHRVLTVSTLTSIALTVSCATKNEASLSGENLNDRNKMSEHWKKKWSEAIGEPTNYAFEHTLKLDEKFSTEDFDGEIYSQANAPSRSQKMLLMLPKGVSFPCPGVIVPYYFPDNECGYDLHSKKKIGERGARALHLVRRGYIVITAETYHLTYIDSDLELWDSTRWPKAAEALMRDHPRWTGMGKLIADTKLLVDVLEADPRCKADKIGVLGHSLGGKIAFYTGCLDARIKAIVASDFGIGWEQSNWRSKWYWGSQVDALIAAGMDHSQLLNIGDKPFMLLAGKFDNEDSRKYLNGKAILLNHASGHQPTQESLEAAMDFLDQHLKGENREESQ